MLKIALVVLGISCHLVALAVAGCVCANTAVIMRTGSSTHYSMRGTLYPGYCVTVKSTSGRRNQGYYWRNVDYQGQNTWIPDNGNWLREDRSCSRGPVLSGSRPSGSGSSSGGSTGSGSSGSCPNIVSRAAWGASRPATTPVRLRNTPRYVFIHHSATDGCNSQATCKALVKSFQNTHMNIKGWNDIGYSFVVGEDGNVYEGRGWGVQGAHTLNYNSLGIGICIAGNYMGRMPDSDAINAVKRLIECGVRQGHITENYTLKGHRDVGSTECPGDQLYNAIRSWPHYR